MKRLNQWARLPKKQHVVFACLVLLTTISHAYAQVFMLLDGYGARTPHDIRPIYRMYEKHFESKEEAVDSHKKVLDININIYYENISKTTFLSGLFYLQFLK